MAVITDDRELVRLLKYLELPTEFPKIRPAPKSLVREYPPQATGPPDDGCQLDPRADLYDGIDAPAPAD